MNNRYIFRPASTQEWADVPVAHWQHTQNYADFQLTLGREVQQVLVHKKETQELVGYYVLVSYPIGYNLRIADMPYGPVWFETPSDELLTTLGEHLYNHTSEAIAVRVQLPRPHHSFRPAPYASETSFGQPRGEAVLDITPDIDTLWSQCSKSTRRNITKSQRHNLDVEFVHGADMLTYRDDFVRLNETTASEHKTTTHNRDHFEALFSTLAKHQDNCVVVVRDPQGSIHAINIITIFNSRAYCPYGASTSHGKQKLGAYYFIKWEIIKYLKNQGVTEFNWGGISVGADDASLRGLNQFKRGFGTTPREHSQRYDLVLSWWYHLYILRAYIKHIQKVYL